MLIVLLALAATADGQAFDDYEMASDEAEAAYDVLEAINGSVPWRTLHPDNLCLFGPHGLNCDIDENNVLHVVEFNFGWVAESDNNAQCNRNATISASLMKLPYLKKLLFYNCFTEEQIEIPSVIWSLGASLQHLVFMRNSALVGQLSGELAKLSQLERLVLMDNGLEGPIPPEIGRLTKLSQLVLSGNKLTGSIPDAIGSLQLLKLLDLNANRLQGGIPAAISQLSKLEKLDLSSNALTNGIPSQLGSLTSLQLLDLSHNNLTGCIPESLGSMNQVRIIQLSSNNFSGDVPNSIWLNLTHLVGLGLSNAGLEGMIPPSLGELPHLNYLDLSNNKLAGTIPFTLGHLLHVYQINLSHNDLFGLLPFSAEFVSKMGRNLLLRGNRGLCLGSDWPLLPKGFATEGLATCNNEYWASNIVQQPFPLTHILSGSSHVSQSAIVMPMSLIGLVFL
ncbi:hypothetical protein L7F22_060206 [Adiantum nelumboides]|nr:hypothetical protein [Adiantum nelumboides]